MKRKKRLLWALLLPVALYLPADVYLWVAYNVQNHERDISVMVKRAKALPKLPEKVFKAYEKVYPGSLENKIVPDLLWIAGADSYGHYPQCRIAHGLLQPFTGKLQVYMCANELENHLTNKECLNLMLHEFDFCYTAVGAGKAAQKYFRKNIEDLNEQDCLELVVMTINPALYNKFTHPLELEKMVRKYL